MNPDGTPPVNTSSSYYDGTSCIDLRRMKADQFVSIDFAYLHIDLSALVHSFLFESFRAGRLTDVKRSITMGIHSPGIAILCTRLKMHSNRSVGSREAVHIGTGGKVTRIF